MNHVMLVHPPSIWAAYGTQRVAWRAHLYQYNGSQFVWVDSTKWRFSSATAARPASFTTTTSGFAPPRAGTYRVSVEIYWYSTSSVSAGRVTVWAPNENLGPYCSFSS